MTEEELKEVFDAFKFEGTDYITTVSLKRVMATLGEKLTTEEINALIKAADKDKTGKVSFEEFKQMVTGDS
ncbi:Calmodulin [Entamoeba marina]